MVPSQKTLHEIFQVRGNSNKFFLFPVTGFGGPPTVGFPHYFYNIFRLPYSSWGSFLHSQPVRSIPLWQETHL